MGHPSDFAELWLPHFDPVTGSLILPLWLAAVIAALVVTHGALALGRAAREGILDVLSRAGFLLIGAAVAWIAFDARSAANFSAQRQALDARALELTTRAIMPG